MAEPLTFRYQNPGAVEYQPWMAKYGARVGENGRYAHFPDAQSGYAAMGQILDTYQNKHGLNTVSGIINRWAPSNVDNNSTGGYINSVASRLGVDPNQPLDPAMKPALMRAMAHYEAGKPFPEYASSPIGANSPQMGANSPAASPPPPQQAPQSMLVPQEDNSGLVGMFRNAIENPLTMAGLGLMSSSAQGKDIGTGLINGIGMGREADKWAQERKKTQALQRLLAGGAPGMEGVPPALMAIAQATGDPSPIAQHIIKGGGTDDIKEFEYAKARGFQGSLQDWLVNKRASQGEYAKQLVYGSDAQGNIVPMQAGSRGDLIASKMPAGVQLQRDPIKIETATGTVLIDPTTRQQMGFVPKNVAEGARQTVEGRETGERQMAMPKAEAALSSADAKTDVVLNALGDARRMVGQWTTGIPGAVLQNVPGTAAKDLKERIKTVVANAGFEELQTMRANSPTGGALGQVAVQELEMLQKTVTSLEQAQSPEQVAKALDEMEAFAKGSRDRRRRAFDMTYGNIPQPREFTGAPAPRATQAVPVRVTSPDEARRLPSGTRIIIPGARPGDPDREGVVP